MTGPRDVVPPSFAIVVPTIGRPSLSRLLEALDDALERGPAPREIVLVDDRPVTGRPLLHAAPPARLVPLLRVVRTGRGSRGGGQGPATARNAGWRAVAEAFPVDWVAFLDDDVVPDPDWLRALADDLTGLPPHVGGSQGRIRVPLPADRRPTDWERNTAGLAKARWITADMAYRRIALAAAGGFDERFRRAFREDSDLALRMIGAGYRLVRGTRAVTHPVRPAGRWASVRAQAGNADDALMHRLHGPGWRSRAGVAPGRRPRHLAVVAAGMTALALGRRCRPVARLAAAGWLAGTAELTLARVRPGPRTPDEVATMVATSVVLPYAATYHWLRGMWRYRGVTSWRPRAGEVPGGRSGGLRGTPPPDRVLEPLLD